MTMSGLDKAKAFLQGVSEKCDEGGFLIGEVIARDWSVEAEIRNGMEKAKVVVWFNAKGQLTPKVQAKQGPFKELLETYLYDDAPLGSPFLPKNVSSWIGVDESGKGDYFGGLVTAAVLLTPETIEALRGVRLRDSKTLHDASIIQSAQKLRAVLGDRCTVVQAYPERYNEMIDGTGFGGNSNRLLAWQHARAIENLLEAHPTTTHAISDQFAKSESTLKSSLMPKGKGITLVQRTHAEEDPAVAAASILARAAFLGQLRKLEQQCGCKLPLGATNEAGIKTAVHAIIAKEGRAALAKYVKVHFKTTQKVLQ
jgi:ribonuclease HIII